MTRWATLLCVLGSVVVTLAEPPQTQPTEARKLTEEEKRLLIQQLGQRPPTQPTTTAPTTMPTPEEGLAVRVKLETSAGDILVELDGGRAPISCKNFVDYVKAGFYDGLIFHRVMPNFMIQGGGFLPDMTEKKDGLRPPIKNEWQNGLKNVRGSIAMARTQAPDSATAQFYINVVDNPPLDMPRGGAAYAVFGRVVEGMETVDKIKDTPCSEHPKLPMGKVVPVEPVLIKKASLVGAFDEAKLTAKCEVAKKAADEAAAKAAEEREKAAAERAKQLDEFIAKKETELGKKFEATPSGLKSVVLKEGDGTPPARTDTVKVHYVGTLVDGKEFDSSVRRGQPATFRLDQVIPGWTEGVSMMKPGEKRLFIIPPNLAYGPREIPGIPANSTLIFDVELIEVNPK
jgi:peptidyl-prolyl cis-trans isomerase A (cyclophilin A)